MVANTAESQSPQVPQVSNLQTSRSTTDTRILQLLGQGIPASMVASTVGVSDSYISQLISDDTFKGELQELKFESLQKHNKRDEKYDELEDKLTKTFETNMVLMQKPQELLRAIQIVNSLKRRGSGTPEAVLQQQTVVTLVMPQKIVQSFTTNINNQVVNIGEQTLETMQSSSLLNKVRAQREALTLENNSTTPTGTPNDYLEAINSKELISTLPKTSSSK